MKLFKCNGRLLEVRDAGPVIFRLLAPGVPIKLNGYRLLEDDEARVVLRDLLASGLYEGGKVPLEPLEEPSDGPADAV